MGVDAQLNFHKFLPILSSHSQVHGLSWTEGESHCLAKIGGCTRANGETIDASLLSQFNCCCCFWKDLGWTTLPIISLRSHTSDHHRFNLKCTHNTPFFFLFLFFLFFQMERSDRRMDEVIAEWMKWFEWTSQTKVKVCQGKRMHTGHAKRDRENSFLLASQVCGGVNSKTTPKVTCYAWMDWWVGCQKREMDVKEMK